MLENTKLRFFAPGATVAATMMALAVFPNISSMLEFNREKIFYGEWWRLFGGSMVHYSWRHMLANTICIFFLMGIIKNIQPSLPILGKLIFGTVFISVGLLSWVPDLNIYRGASGLTTMLIVLASLLLWEEKRTVAPLLVIALTSLKLLLEVVNIKSDWSGMPVDIEISWQAHGFGFLAALIIFLFQCLVKRGGRKERVIGQTYLSALSIIKRNKSPA